MPNLRRKSGPNSANSSTTDVRKVVAATDARYKRPVMTRRHTPSSAQKLGCGHREQEEIWDNDERESFPQFCMTCEKQFVPHDEKFLYCSDACRHVDQKTSASQAATLYSYYSSINSRSNYNCNPNYNSSYNHNYNNNNNNNNNNNSHYLTDKPEPRDIVPRASPSTPSSMNFSNSPPASPGITLTQHHTSAMSALRSLNMRPPSPPSPTGSSGIWPFSRSTATSPSSSYIRPSTYDLGYGGAYSRDVRSESMERERPLLSRNPGGHSRPRSIELVLPHALAVISGTRAVWGNAAS